MKKSFKFWNELDFLGIKVTKLIWFYLLYWRFFECEWNRKSKKIWFFSAFLINGKIATENRDSHQHWQCLCFESYVDMEVSFGSFSNWNWCVFISFKTLTFLHLSISDYTTLQLSFFSMVNEASKKNIIRL